MATSTGRIYQIVYVDKQTNHSMSVYEISQHWNKQWKSQISYVGFPTTAMLENKTVIGQTIWKSR